MANNERDILVSRYFEEGLTYVEILSVLNYDHGIYISLRHLHRILRSLMLCRRHYSVPRSIVDFVTDSIRHSGRLHGYRIMRQRCIANGLRVRTQDVVNILRICDPMESRKRRLNRIEEFEYIHLLAPVGDVTLTPDVALNYSALEIVFEYALNSLDMVAIVYEKNAPLV